MQRIEEACCRLESRDVATAGRLEGEAAGGKAPLLCCASAHQELGERMSRLEEAVGSIDKKLDRVLGLLMSRVN